MRLSLTEHAPDLAGNRELIGRALCDDEKIVGPAALVPACMPDELAVYEVWWPLSTGQFVTVGVDGAMVYVDDLPTAEDFENTGFSDA